MEKNIQWDNDLITDDDTLENINNKDISIYYIISN